MSDRDETKPGVWASLKRVLDTLLATAQNRVELFAVELHEEKCRLVEALLFAAAVAAFGIMTLSLATFTLVLLFWENGRRHALVGLSVLYLTATALAWRGLKSRLAAPSAFAGSLDELKRDRECLRTDNGTAAVSARRFCCGEAPPSVARCWRKRAGFVPSPGGWIWGSMPHAPCGKAGFGWPSCFPCGGGGNGRRPAGSGSPLTRSPSPVCWPGPGGAGAQRGNPGPPRLFRGLKSRHGFMMTRFRDRTEAGRLLAERLQKYANRGDVLALALPRGGVPVGYEAALALNAPLDVFVARKLGVPGHEERAGPLPRSSGA
jgi:uncharacterized membrane protein YqjE